MGDSAMTVIAIALAAILMFVFPLMSISERNDDISQMAVQTSTTEFVNNARTVGALRSSDYDAFIQEISSTGNNFDVEIEIKRMDTNPSAKLAQATTDKVGENIYYSIYTSQIEKQWEDGDGKIALKEGDIVTVTVKNTNKTIAQMFKSVFYSMTGDDTYQIAAKHSGVVSANGI